MKTGSDRKYTPEFRESAVKQVKEGGRGMSAVARSLEMSNKTLANWVYLVRKGQELVTSPRKAGQPVTELEAELSRLKQENARLRVEKEILKKAAAYFARELM
jgi:transposase